MQPSPPSWLLALRQVPRALLSLSIGYHNPTNLFSSLVISKSNRLRMLDGMEWALVSSHPPRGASPSSSSRHDGASIQPIALRVEGGDRVRVAHNCPELCAPFRYLCSEHRGP